MSKSDSKRQAILENAYRLFRAQGFDGTSMADITNEVGGSKATLYSHFPSKEELFVECMMAALENYMADTLKHLDVTRTDPEAALRNFGTSVLNFICSPEQVEVRRLMIAEAARSGTGKLFFEKLAALRSKISSFLDACMVSGLLRLDDPDLAADHLGALLEAEVLERLLQKGGGVAQVLVVPRGSVSSWPPHSGQLNANRPAVIYFLLRLRSSLPGSANL
jgi:AcrR family transcriptional regulator